MDDSGIRRRRATVDHFYYDDLREKWKHEDHLINQRVTWLLASEGFLLAAFGALSASGAGSAGWDKVSLLIIQTAIPLVGILVASFIREGIQAAITAMEVIKKTLAERQAKGLIKPFLAVDVLGKTTSAGAMAPLRLASGISVLWLVLLAVQLVRLVVTLRPPQ